MTEQEELKIFMINASGDHLTEMLPSNFDEMENDKLMEFIQENLWQPFDDYYDMPEQIYEFIQNSAYSTMKFVRELNLIKGEGL